MKKAQLLLIVLFVTLFAISLDGCATVKVPNVEFCADKGMEGAVCDFTNDGPETHLNKLEWDQKRFGMACTDVESVTKLLGVIEKLCFDDPRCDFETKKEMVASIDRVKNILYRVSRNGNNQRP